MLARLRLAARSPLAWILLAVGLLHVVGIGWGLPWSDGWDNDGVAPRDFLPGLAATFTQGRYYTYPPVHLAILAILTLPITVVGVLRAPSFGQADVVAELLKTPYMTSMALVARLVAVAMSVGIVFFTARLAEEIRAWQLETDTRDQRVRRVGWLVAACVGVDASLTYYGKTSNLDVPYLFWGFAALLVFVRALVWNEPKLVRRAAVLAALAIGTKDQAYALFVLSLPVLAIGWLALRRPRKTLLRELAIGAGLAVLTLAVADGAVVNPTGFRARLAFLSGSASQDYAEFTRDWTGRARLLREAWRTIAWQYPWYVALVFAGGLVRAVVVALQAGRRASSLLLALAPLLVALSFTVAFNFTARRADARFVMPQALLLGVYGGFALEPLVFAKRKVWRIAGQAVASFVVASALFLCMSVDENILHDPRYDAEEWLRARVRPGDVVETYGLNVYLPRISAKTLPGARVVRVGPEPPSARNPLPGVEELQAPYEAAHERKPRFILIPTAWSWRYSHRHPVPLPAGKEQAPLQVRTEANEVATRYFDRLTGNELEFRFVFMAKLKESPFPNVDVHGASGRWIWIYELQDPPR